jgi:hypothetical protein
VTAYGTDGPTRTPETGGVTADAVSTYRGDKRGESEEKRYPAITVAAEISPALEFGAGGWPEFREPAGVACCTREREIERMI